MSPNSS